MTKPKAKAKTKKPAKRLVRIASDKPTPFVRKHLDKLAEAGKRGRVVDIGCGNGRNLKALHEAGCTDLVGIDVLPVYNVTMPFAEYLSFDANDFAGELDWPEHKLEGGTVYLLNYVLMFLEEYDREEVVFQVMNIAAEGALIMIELYPSKNGYMPTKAACDRYFKELLAECADSQNIDGAMYGFEILDINRSEHKLLIKKVKL
jgi:SAM-dependent methyltransferase